MSLSLRTGFDCGNVIFIGGRITVALTASSFLVGVALGNPKPAPAPARPAAAPHVGGSPMGGMRMPGGAGGGAHIPGNMGGGAHIPGNMGGGAHIPGNMAGNAHIPGNMGGEAHVPGNMGMARSSNGMHAGGAASIHRASGEMSGHYGSAGVHTAGGHEAGVREAGVREAGGHGGALHQGGGRETAAHDGRGYAGGLHGGAGLHGGGTLHGGEHGAGIEHAGLRGDPRIGGGAALHTRGLDAAALAHHEPRPFLHADEHRDIGRDHAFVAAHAHDFHTRNVRDFNAHELAAWRGGTWRNEWHYGRRGWWWDVDGVWYPYADPIFPYPYEVAALTVYDAPYIDGPDLTAEEVAVNAPPGIPPLPPAPPGYYRCDQPGGYFPGVGACGGPWDLVPQPPPSYPQ